MLEQPLSTGDLTVFFLRHGDAQIDASYYPRHDIMPLSELGREQALNAARCLAGIRFSKIYASPLQRCHETATIITQANGLMFETDPRLEERVFKELYGMPYAQIAQSIGEEAALSLQTGRSDDIHLPGAESIEQCRQRVWLAFYDMVQSATGPVLVVSHGGPHEWLIKSIMKTPEALLRRRCFTLDKCGLSVFSCPGHSAEAARLARLNLPCWASGAASLTQALWPGG